MKQNNIRKIYQFLYLLLLLWFGFTTYYSIIDIPRAQLGYGYVFWLLHILIFFVLILLNPIHKWILHLIFVTYIIFVKIILDVPLGNYLIIGIFGVSILTLFLTREIKVELKVSFIGFGLGLTWLFLTFYFELF